METVNLSKEDASTDRERAFVIMKEYIKDSNFLSQNWISDQPNVLKSDSCEQQEPLFISEAKHFSLRRV